MFAEFKYVVFRGEEVTPIAHRDSPGVPIYHEVPVLFPGIMTHKDFARLRRHQHLTNVQIIAAGFVTFSFEGVHCHGRSESLNMDGRGEIDAEIIRKSCRHMLGTRIKEQQ